VQKLCSDIKYPKKLSHLLFIMKMIYLCFEVVPPFDLVPAQSREQASTNISHSLDRKLTLNIPKLPRAQNPTVTLLQKARGEFLSSRLCVSRCAITHCSCGRGPTPEGGHLLGPQDEREGGSTIRAAARVFPSRVQS
jgi:hypothetical protein